MGRGQKNYIFPFSRDLDGHAPRQADWALRLETGVGADGPVHDTCTHTTHGYRKWGPWAGEKRNGAAYVMPDWAGRMASITMFLFDCYDYFALCEARIKNSSFSL